MSSVELWNYNILCDITCKMQNVSCLGHLPRDVLWIKETSNYLTIVFVLQSGHITLECMGNDKRFCKNSGRSY